MNRSAIYPAFLFLFLSITCCSNKINSQATAPPDEVKANILVAHSASLAINPSKRQNNFPDHASAIASASTDHFRSRQSGDWSSPGTWESSSDSVVWQVATIVPTSAAKSITIRSGFQVAVSDVNQTMDRISVNDTLKFTVDTTKFVMPNNGTMNINSGGVLKFSQKNINYSELVSLGTNSKITINSGGMISVSSISGSNGMNAFAIDATGTYVWKNNSIFEWNYSRAFTTANLTYFPNADAATIPIFRVTKSAVVGAGPNSPTKILGILEINTGNTVFTWQNNGVLNCRNGIRGSGQINFSEGETVIIGDYSGTATATAQIGGSGNITKGTGTTLTMRINNLCNATLTSSKAINSATINIYPKATLDAGTYQITGSADTLAVSGTFKTANASGFSGASSGSVPRTAFNVVSLNSGSTVDYTLPDAQAITPDVYDTLMLSGTGVKSLAGDVTTTSRLALAGSTLSIGSNTLTLKGSITRTTGSLSGAATAANALSNLVLDGAAAKALYFTPGNYYLHNVTINSTATNVSLLDSLYITGGNAFGTLTVNGALNTGGFLTIKSDASGDGVVGTSASNANNTITGNVTVERFIPKRKAWRFMGIPTTGTQSINEAWQEGNLPNSTTNAEHNDKPGYGTEITYNNNQSLGFDLGITNNPSLKTYSTLTNSWQPVVKTYQPINDYAGTNLYSAYCLFVRGSRSIQIAQGTNAIPDNTILRTSGTLNTGLFSHRYTTVANTVVLVSNPFASPINILGVLARNASKFTQNKFWVWDPAAPGLHNVGAYVVYNNGLQIPQGSSYAGGTNAQSGQAFMLEATAGGTTSISFSESDKTNAQTNVFGKAVPKAMEAPPAIFVNLLTRGADSNLLIADGVAAGFSKAYSEKVTSEDSKKMWNYDENLSLYRDSQPLSIELRPVPKKTDTLFFKLYVKQQPYTLQIFAHNLPAKGWLVDKYLNSHTELNLYDTLLYRFIPNSDTTSYRNRFMLVFQKTGKDSLKSIHTKADNDSQAAQSISGEANVLVYPNPIQDRKAMLRLTNLQADTYLVRMFSVGGQMVYQKRMVIGQSGITQMEELLFGKSLAKGSYRILITDGKSHIIYSRQLTVNR